MQNEYFDYLDSPEWSAVRQRALKRAGYHCERNAHHAGPLHVHHRTYRNLGHEPDRDVEVLCEPCHRDEFALRNKQLRALEHEGQLRLFERWFFPSRRRMCP